MGDWTDGLREIVRADLVLPPGPSPWREIEPPLMTSSRRFGIMRVQWNNSTLAPCLRFLARIPSCHWRSSSTLSVPTLSLIR